MGQFSEQIHDYFMFYAVWRGYQIKTDPNKIVTSKASKVILVQHGVVMMPDHREKLHVAWQFHKIGQTISNDQLVQSVWYYISSTSLANLKLKMFS